MPNIVAVSLENATNILTVRTKSATCQVRLAAYSAWRSAHPTATAASVEAAVLSLLNTVWTGRDCDVYLHIYSLGPPPRYALRICDSGIKVPADWWTIPPGQKAP